MPSSRLVSGRDPGLHRDYIEGDRTITLWGADMSCIEVELPAEAGDSAYVTVRGPKGAVKYVMQARPAVMREFAHALYYAHEDKEQG